MPGWQELLVILVIVVIIFGGSKIAGVGKASGRAIREFKDELKGPEAPTAIPPAPGTVANYPAAPAEPTAQTADLPTDTTSPGQTTLR